MDGPAAARAYLKVDTEVPVGAYQAVAIGIAVGHYYTSVLLGEANAPGAESVSHAVLHPVE